MIRVISYDVWRTLLRVSPKYTTQRSLLIKASLRWQGSDADMAAAIVRASHELDQLSDTTGVQCGFVPRVHRAAELLKVDIPTNEQLACLNHEVASAHLQHPPTLTDPQLPTLLAQHRSNGRRVAVISNTGMTEGAILRKLLDTLGLLENIEYELYSDILNLAKPDPRIFEELSRQSGEPARNILHIGDNKTADYQGAIDAGLQALLYSPATVVDVPSIKSHGEVLSHPLLAND